MRLYGALAEGALGDTAMFRRSLNNVEAERDETLRMIAALEKHREAAPLARKAQYRSFAQAARAACATKAPTAQGLEHFPAKWTPVRVAKREKSEN